MGAVGYGYGSEWHLLRYLGYHHDELSGRVLAGIAVASVKVFIIVVGIDRLVA